MTIDDCGLLKDPFRAGEESMVDKIKKSRGLIEGYVSVTGGKVWYRIVAF